MAMMATVPIPSTVLHSIHLLHFHSFSNICWCHCHSRAGSFEWEPIFRVVALFSSGSPFSELSIHSSGCSFIWVGVHSFKWKFIFLRVAVCFFELELIFILAIHLSPFIWVGAISFEWEPFHLSGSQFIWVEVHFLVGVHSFEQKFLFSEWEPVFLGWSSYLF